VFQGAAIRLLRALEVDPVVETREFMNLAATHVRWELIDLARHFYGPHGIGANHGSADPDRSGAAIPDAVEAEKERDDLERWTALHEAAELLPVDEREVFGLVIYHGWTQNQVAELFGVSDRTIRTRWKSACRALRDAIGGDLPDAS